MATPRTRTGQRRSATADVRPATLGRPGDVLAPAPQLDRYPAVIGAGVTLAYISGQMRMATDGQREGYCDLLNELIERDPHAYSVVMKRILAVAGGRIEITPAVTEAGDPEYERAAEIASFVGAQLAQMDDLATPVAGLLWGLFYGVVGAEIIWERDGADWIATCLEPVLPRRLWYPDPGTWDVYVYQSFDVATNNFRGLRVADYPGKFILHAPNVRGDAPTREGLGRELAYWMALKGMGARAAAAYVEGYSRPRPVAYYSTGQAGAARAANARDIATAKATVQALGQGTLASAVLPDSIKIELQRVPDGITHEAWIAICDNQITKAVLGQTGTTDIGKNGSRAQAETMREDQVQLTRYDAQALAGTLRRDLVRPITLLNFPDARRLVPRVTVHANDDPDPNVLLQRATQAVDVGLPVDADRLGAIVGLPLVAPGDANARVLQRPGAARPAPGQGPTDDGADAADAAEQPLQ